MSERETLTMLAAFLAGTTDRDEVAPLVEHFAACPPCREWTGAAEHPSSLELARKAVASLDQEAPGTELPSAHLAACPACSREVELIRAALAAARPAGSSRPSRRAARRPRLRWAVAAGLLLAAGSALWIFRVAPAPEAHHRVLHGETLAGPQVVEVPGSITAGAVIIEEDARVVLRAGEAVSLGNGFSVAEGATLQIESTRPVPREAPAES